MFIKIYYFGVVTTNPMLLHVIRLYYFGVVTANPMLLHVIRYAILVLQPIKMLLHAIRYAILVLLQPIQCYYM